MIIRRRKKQSGTSEVPVGGTEGPTVSDEIEIEPVAEKKTRARTKVPVTRKSRVVVTPVRKLVPMKKRLFVRGPKTRTAPVSDKESESSQVLEDRELPATESECEDESQLEIERLRKKLAELEVDQEVLPPIEREKVAVGT